MKNNSKTKYLFSLQPNLFWRFFSSVILLGFTTYSSAKSLEQSVAIAFNTNPELKTVFHNYKATIQDLKVAESGWYPTVELDAKIGVGKQNIPASRFGTQEERIEPASYGISLNQILFDGFFTSGNIERSEHQVQSELYLLHATAENKALEVVQVYIEVLKQQQLVELSNMSVESHQTIYHQIKLRTDNGLGSTSELSQVTGRLARAKANLLVSMNNYQDAKTAFIRLVGEPPERLIKPVADSQLIPISEGMLLDKARLQHPTIKAALANIKATESKLKAEQSSFLPKVTLELGSNRSDDFNNDNIETDEVRADIVMSYNIFRGGADSAKELRNAYQVEQAKENKLSAERQVIEGAQFSWNAYDFTRKQLEFLQTHVEQSYITQQAYKEQFELGRRTLLDLLDTESELFEARSNYLNAESAYLIAHYRLFNAMGDLLAGLRIQADEFFRERGYE